MADSEKKREGTRWSYSRVSCFKQCKYEYYLNYILNDPERYLAEGNYYAEVGSYVHEILAMIFRGELNKEEAAAYFIDHFDDNVFYQASQTSMDNAYNGCLSYFENEDFKWLDQYEILGVEKECRFKIKKYEFVGIIDLLLRDKQTGMLVILDHKSAQYPLKKDGITVKKNSEHSFESYKRQMYLYCHAVKEEYGEFPSSIIWNHFKDGGLLAKIPFSMDEYTDTIKWFENTIKEATKEREFEPSPDYFYCRNLCNFRNSCEYVNGGGDS